MWPMVLGSNILPTGVASHRSVLSQTVHKHPFPRHGPHRQHAPQEVAVILATACTWQSSRLADHSIRGLSEHLVRKWVPADHHHIITVFGHSRDTHAQIPVPDPPLLLVQDVLVVEDITRRSCILKSTALLYVKAFVPVHTALVPPFNDACSQPHQHKRIHLQ